MVTHFEIDDAAISNALEILTTVLQRMQGRVHVSA